jgi:uncharacterized membrane protein (UPF0182 family)
MEPFTPVGSGRDNMVAWLAAFSDGSRYGQLTAYEFPKGQTVFGPLQIEAQINQDPTVADILALWSQGGSKVYRGNMLTIPIRDSFLYVEPLYQEATATGLPALRRVIVDYDGQKIAVGNTLDQALTQLFGPLPWTSLNAGQTTATAGTPAQGSSATGPAGSSATSTGPGTKGATAATSSTGAAASATLGQADTLFQQAQSALRQGNFASYAQLITQLGQLLQQASGGAPATPSGGGGSGTGAGLAAAQAVGATGGSGTAAP